MNMIKDRNAQFIVLIGVLLLIILVLFSRTNWLESLENLSLDLRFTLRGAKPFTAPVTIIGIDEASIDTLGRWPWPRSNHAAVLKLLEYQSFRPAAIMYDILFENPDVQFPASDLALADEAHTFGQDLILAYFFEIGSASQAELYPEKEKVLESFAIENIRHAPKKLEEATKVSLPYESLIKETALAFVNNPIDRDGRARRIRLLEKYKGRIYPSTILLSALKLMGANLKDIELNGQALIIKKNGVQQRAIPISDSGDMLINYSGPMLDIPRFSFLEILKDGELWMNKNEEPTKLKSQKGKLVIIGTTALGLEDRRVTPFREYEPAISIQAQAIATIVENKFLKEIPPDYSFGIFLLMGICIIVSVSSQKGIRTFFVMCALILLYLVASYFTFLNNYLIEIANPIVNTAILFIVLLSLRYILTAEELKRTYLQLLHSEKMASLGGLSSEIAHEYRNFLHVIASAADVCTMPNLEKSQYAHCLETIQTAVKKANQVTEGLLTFARKNKPQKKEGNLKTTIDQILLILEKKLMSNNIKVVKELEDVGPISFDEGQMSQVLMNMIRNAEQAFNDRKEGRQITIRLKNFNERILLEIEDNGSGIPKKVRERLFEPFVTSKKAGEGTGLGLSVCHGIIQAHGGDIKVKTAEGKGTTWEIFLPKK